MAKAKSHGNGEGTIYKRPNGTWCAQLMVGYTAEGKRKRWTAYGKTRREVATALADAVRQHKDGQLSAGPRQTVGQFLQRWLEDVVKPSTEPRTYRGYEEIVRLHLDPAFGKKSLNKLGPEEIQSLCTAKLATLSPRRVHHIYACLRTALNVALRWRLIPWNPAAAVKPPKVPKSERRTFTAAEAQRFVTAAIDEPYPYGALWLTAICTAFREGEILNLKWKDADIEHGVFNLQRARMRVGKELIEKAPKSDRGRMIPMIPLVAEMLAVHKKQQVELRGKLSTPWTLSDLIFVEPNGKPIDERDLLRRRFYPFLERVGLPKITFHDLRHSCATLLLSLGVDMKIISTVLGHSTITITADLYTHPVASIQAEAMMKLDKLLRSG